MPNHRRTGLPIAFSFVLEYVFEFEFFFAWKSSFGKKCVRKKKLNSWNRGYENVFECRSVTGTAIRNGTKKLKESSINRSMEEDGWLTNYVYILLSLLQCVENVSRSHCPVCLGDIHTSRIPCHIPDCGHLLHRMCFDQLLASGHYTCPTCQTSLIDMTALWEYLDAQALRMPIPLKYENQRVHIFCNDCHKVTYSA